MTNADVILRIQQCKRYLLEDKNTEHRGTHLLLSTAHIVAYYAATGFVFDYLCKDFPVPIVKADVSEPTLVIKLV